MATYDVGATGILVAGPSWALDGSAPTYGALSIGVGALGVLVPTGYGFAAASWEGWKPPNTTGQLWPRGGRGNGYFTS